LETLDLLICEAAADAACGDGEEVGVGGEHIERITHAAQDVADGSMVEGRQVEVGGLGSAPTKLVEPIGTGGVGDLAGGGDDAQVEARRERDEVVAELPTDRFVEAAENQEQAAKRAKMGFAGVRRRRENTKRRL